jgi:hypothetical protein
MFGNLIPTILDKHPGTRFIEEIACRTVGGGWSAEPALVFFDPKPLRPEYSNFFAYNRRWLSVEDKPTWAITGLPNFDPVVTALLDDDLLVISRFGHDFVYSPNNGGAIDGGREYIRILGANRQTVPLDLLTLTFELNGERHNVTRLQPDHPGLLRREGAR